MDRRLSRGTKGSRALGRLARTVPLVLLAAAVPAHASFIETLGMGSRAIGMGNAFIGVADDLSANYYNPAGLTQLIGGRTMDSMATANLTYLGIQYREPVFEERSRVRPGQVLEFDPEFPEFAATPTAPFGFELGDRVYVTPLPIQVPFAGSSQFSSTVGDARYTASEVGQIFITWSPSIAFRATEFLSLGVGFDLMIANDVWLKSTIGDGAVGRALGRAATDLLGPAFGRIAESLASTDDGVDDGYTFLRTDQEFRTGLSPVNDVNLDLETPGYHLGLMLFPTEWLRIGALYRSELVPEVEGRIESHFASSIVEGGLFRVLGFKEDEARFTLDFPLPQIVGAGLSARLTSQWMVALDWVWVDWAHARQVDAVVVTDPEDADQPNRGLSETALTQGYQRIVIPRASWKSVHSLRAGVEWRPLEFMNVLTGVWYDPTPTPDRRFDFTSDPGDRISISGAVEIVSLFDGRLDLGAHIQYIFIQDRHVQVGEGEILGGSSELVLPDDDGAANPAFVPNDTFSVVVGGEIINWGLTLTMHM